MCRVFSCVVGRGCLLWPVPSLGKTLRAFALLHSVLRGQICLLLRYFLTPYFCIPVSYNAKDIFFGVLVLKVLVCLYVCVLCVLVAQSCLTFCDPMDCSAPGSSVHEIFQVRILEWVAISFSRGSSWPRDRTQVSCTAGRFFTDPHLYYPIFSGLLQNSLVNSILIFLTGILLDKTVHYEINISSPLSH